MRLHLFVWIDILRFPRVDNLDDLHNLRNLHSQIDLRLCESIRILHRQIVGKVKRFHYLLFLYFGLLSAMIA